MLLIILLIITGALLLIAEIVLLPGLSIAGICSLIAYGIAIYKAFSDYGISGGFIVIVAAIATAVFSLIFCLKAKTWQRFSLKSSIDGKSQESPEEDDNIRIGDVGTTLTRLAPMGKIMVNGKTYEAKAIDAYLTPGTDIEVTAFENFTVVVKKHENQQQL